MPGAVAVLARSPAVAAGNVPVCRDLRAFLEHKPQVVIECASRDALAEIGPKVLAAGCDLVPLSLTALADREVERRLMAAAEAGPGRIEIAPGAIGTLDLLATAREEGITRVVYRQLKSPAMWKLVAAARGVDFDPIASRTVFRRGSVRELATDFANNLNTSVGVALAGLGPRPHRGRTGRRSRVDRDGARARNPCRARQCGAEARRPRRAARRRSGRLHDLQPDARSAPARRPRGNLKMLSWLGPRVSRPAHEFRAGLETRAPSEEDD